MQDGREINDERRSGRWGLQVPNIRPEDSGTYTCQAINPFGSINASFIIQVVRKSLSLSKQKSMAGPLRGNQRHLAAVYAVHVIKSQNKTKGREKLRAVTLGPSGGQGSHSTQKSSEMRRWSSLDWAVVMATPLFNSRPTTNWRTAAVSAICGAFSSFSLINSFSTWSGSQRPEAGIRGSGADQRDGGAGIGDSLAVPRHQHVATVAAVAQTTGTRGLRPPPTRPRLPARPGRNSAGQSLVQWTN